MAVANGLVALALAVLFAPSAQAVTVAELEVDPGTLGMSSDGFVFSLDEEVEVVDINFSDGKSLGFPLLDPSQLAFAIQGPTAFPIVGFLTDENGRPIDGTGFVGSVDLGVTNAPTNDFFPEGTIWSDMLFAGPFVPGDYTLAWLNEPAPTVIPEPGTFALLSLGLVGMGVRRRGIALS